MFYRDDKLSLVNKIKHKLHWKSKDLLFNTGLSSPGMNKASGSRILVYHNVTMQGNRDLNSRFISALEFEKQLVEMKKHWQIVPLKKIVTGETEPGKFSVALTFDDGLANNLHTILPLLEKYEVPAAFFVTSAPATGAAILWPDLVDLVSFYFHEPLTIKGEKFISKNKRYYSANSHVSLNEACIKKGSDFIREMINAFPPEAMKFKNDERLTHYWKLMNPGEIKKLAASPLVTIGSHGQTHCSLTHVTAEEAGSELKDSKQWLGSLVQKEVDLFAYPFGHYNDELVRLAASCGYTQHLLVDYTSAEDKTKKHLHARMGNNPYISWKSQLHAYAKGKY